MKVLFIGGTAFLGRHAAEALDAAGHDITLFHRGLTGSDVLPDSEHVFGDRDRDLGLLGSSRWDVVVDVCAYLPRQVRAVVDGLGASIDRYCFISTVSAHRLTGAPLLTESSAMYSAEDLSDPQTDIVDAQTYGPLKSLCETVATEAFGDAALIVRPTYVIGPHDPTDRFVYWLRRIERGGEVLFAGPADAPIQLIDARDIAAFLVDLLEAGDSGAWNVAGPDMPLAWSELIDSLTQMLGPVLAQTWVENEFLRTHGVEAESAFPLWRSSSEAERMHCDSSKSRTRGLVLRPLAESVQDVRDWDVARGLPEIAVGLPADQETELLNAWHVHQ